MATYIILNCIVIALVCLALRVRPRRFSTAWTATLISLTLLTAVFDNIIIWAKIVGYDTTKILGAYVGIAPVEDFMYALLAVIVVPAIWNKFGETHAR